MGTARTGSWGYDLTGKNALDLMTPSLALAARSNMKTMYEHPCGMHHMTYFTTISGREQHMENITVPVSNDPGLPHRLLNFINELSTLDFSAPDGEVRSAAKVTWLDIGAGVPKKGPAK